VVQNESYGQITRWVLIAVVFFILLIAVYYIRSILLLALASVILVVLFTMPVRVLARYGVSRGPAILISLAGIVAIFILLGIVALPGLLEQFSTLLTETVPNGIRELARQWDAGELQQQYPFLTGIQDFINNTFQGGSLDATLNELGRQLAGALGQLGTSVLPVLGGVANTLLSLLIVIFLSMYFLADPRGHEEGIIKLFPIWYRYRVREILNRVDFNLRGWLKTTIISMIFAGIVTWLGLSLLGLQQAAALGVLAGLMSFIPNFGQIAALVPAIAVGFVDAPQNIGWIIVIIYGVSFIQSQVISPLLISESINIPPVMVLLGQIISGAFFGFMGILLAVPITAIAMILVQEIYIKDVLGDRTEVEIKHAHMIVVDDVLTPDGT
jgi:predicted PurR-regulated permease PerM